jgi:hypothetical protein
MTVSSLRGFTAILLIKELAGKDPLVISTGPVPGAALAGSSNRKSFALVMEPDTSLAPIKRLAVAGLYVPLVVAMAVISCVVPMAAAKPVIFVQLVVVTADAVVVR